METNEENICLICTDLVQDPIECPGCRVSFCKSCAERWKERSNQCPLKCHEAPWKIKIQAKEKIKKIILPPEETKEERKEE